MIKKLIEGANRKTKLFFKLEVKIHSVCSFHYLNKKGSGKSVPLLTGAGTGGLMPSCFAVVEGGCDIPHNSIATGVFIY